MIVKKNSTLMQHIANTPIPRMTWCHWNYPCPHLINVENELTRALRPLSLNTSIKPGHHIAIATGSRKIADIVTILSVICHEVKRTGAKPFIVPAMGSHGGGTLRGQMQVLKQLGITPESVGAPLLGSEKPLQIGKTPTGIPVFIDERAWNADGIIIVNRIKPHTSFSALFESGLQKMLAVGLGKAEGAQQIHRLGTFGLNQIIGEVAQVLLDRAPIVAGVGIIENAQGEVARIDVLKPHEIPKEEPRLLRKAKALMPSIPFKQIDVLIVQEMGKDISGTGMDTNIIGRRMIAGEPEPLLPQVSRIAVLSLTDSSHGNAIGLGLADIITRRLYNSIDVKKTLLNVLTTTFIERAKVPIAMPTDRSAIQLALKTCWARDPSHARVMWIKNTADLKKFAISSSLQSEAAKNDALLCSQQSFSLAFDSEGQLKQQRRNKEFEYIF